MSALLCESGHRPPAAAASPAADVAAAKMGRAQPSSCRMEAATLSWLQIPAKICNEIPDNSENSVLKWWNYFPFNLIQVRVQLKSKRKIGFKAEPRKRRARYVWIENLIEMCTLFRNWRAKVEMSCTHVRQKGRVGGPGGGQGQSLLPFPKPAPVLVLTRRRLGISVSVCARFVALCECRSSAFHPLFICAETEPRSRARERASPLQAQKSDEKKYKNELQPRCRAISSSNNNNKKTLQPSHPPARPTATNHPLSIPIYHNTCPAI